MSSSMSLSYWIYKTATSGYLVSSSCIFGYKVLKCRIKDKKRAAILDTSKFTPKKITRIARILMREVKYPPPSAVELKE